MRMPMLALLAAVLVLAPTLAQDCTTLTASGDPVTIYSPNYPSNYPSGSDECWIVEPEDQSKFVSITVLEMKLEKPCGPDYVSLKKGLTSSGDELARLCGRKSEQVVYLSRTGFYIHFHSDNHFEKMGFMLEYKSEEEGCETLVAMDTEQSFTSPNFPDYYDNDEDVCWNIVSLDATKSVELSVKEIDVEYHGYCNYDYVDILDGADTSGTILDTLCGDDATGTYLGRNGLHIDFHSDNQGRAKGFEMTYTTANTSCVNLTATPTPAELKSPNYPYAYPKGVFQCWEITSADTSMSVKLAFQSMDLESSDNCTYDYLKVRALNSNENVHRLCGNQKQNSSVVYNDGAYVEFSTDMYTERYGFLINYFASN